MKMCYLALVPIIPAAIYAVGYVRQKNLELQTTLADLKAQAKMSEIHYQALRKAAPQEVIDQILTDIKFRTQILLEE